MALGFIILLYVALRLSYIGATSLWNNEILLRYYGNVRAALTLDSASSLTSATPPPYYFVLVLGEPTAQRERRILVSGMHRRQFMNAPTAERLHVAYFTEPEILQGIEAKHSVWVLSNGFDLTRVNDLRGREPATVFSGMVLR